MDERCISLKYLIIVVSFFFLLDNHLANTIAVDRNKKDNHTIKEELRKIHDQKASPSNFRMHGLHPLFGKEEDQLKTLYTNLGSANNQVQLKYITGQGLLTPLIIRASDLGLTNEQAQLHSLPDFLNEFNNLNQNQFSLRPPRHKNHMPNSRPNLFSPNYQTGITKRPRRKRKKQAFKFNDQDSMEFSRPNSMEFIRHNSMEFPHLNASPVKKHINFEKPYDELMHSAKKFADNVENISNGDDAIPESDGKKSAHYFESDASKFNFDDEMRLGQKDEDELDNLEKLENLSDGGSSAIGSKKPIHSDNFNDFESNEKNGFSSDDEKFGDLFGDKFGDPFKDTSHDDEKLDDNYDKLYDKIIENITSSGKEKNKYSSFGESMFEEDKKKVPLKDKKTNKKKTKPIDENVDDTSNEPTSNKDQDEIKLTNENEQTEYNANTSGHTETGEYDYAGYAKDPNEQSEEVPDGEAEKPNDDKNGEVDKGQQDGKYEDAKYQDDQQTTVAPSDNDYKEQSPPSGHQPTKAGDERRESEMRSFGQSAFRNFNSNQRTHSFTRLPINKQRNSTHQRTNASNKAFRSNRLVSEHKIEKFNKPANHSSRSM